MHNIEALCEKSDDAYYGNFALKMSTHKVEWDDIENEIDMGNELFLWGKEEYVQGQKRITGGLPVHARKDTLVFYYKYIPPAGVTDTAELNLCFEKDSIDVNNYRNILLPTDIYTKFEIPYDLDNPYVDVDSMVLELTSSKWRNNWLESDTVIEGSSLYIDYMYFKSQLFHTDSLALVALYNSTNGSTWTNSSNWLIGNVTDWYGVTVSSDRVTQVDLGSNNLVGTIPPEIGNLTNLMELWLNENQLTGAVPNSFNGLIELEGFNLSGNQLKDLPYLSSLSSLDGLQIQNNQFTFKDIEPNIGVASTTYTYSPQDSVGEIIDTTVYIGTSFKLLVSTGGNNSQYQWKKDGT
ncbi:MAG: hypothetical protein KAT38_13065, partial [Bacteroidales bacterium]|nr:hypothetical protein [Bacteroidales bacterium]